jgi:hypothetical protein
MMSAKVMENMPMDKNQEMIMRHAFSHEDQGVPMGLTMYYHSGGKTHDLPSDERELFGYLKIINEDFIDIGEQISIGALNFIKGYVYQLLNLRGERRKSAIEDMLNRRYPFGDADEDDEWRHHLQTDYQ